MRVRIRNARNAKQNVIGGLLIFTILIAVSLALGFYGYYVERVPKTTNTTPTTSPVTTPTTTPTTTPANTTNTTTIVTTPTNTTSEVPYVPE